MTKHARSLFALTIFSMVFAWVPTTGRGQVKDLESHPAYQVVISYLTYAMGQDWPKSAALIEAKSLANLRDRYIKTIEKARTVKEEIDMCRSLDCTNLAEVKTLDPTDFYIRYHNGVQKRFRVTKEKLDGILKSKRVKLISLGEETHEGTGYAHVLVRTKHNNGDHVISSLELISLEKVGGKWMVTLEAMRPTIEPADGGAASATAPKK